ncbi:vezatin [Lates japonicus]|uniref:Vezatin n=1 Tax=Lates japonicus TaxID=270547 RepID=A0AAD3NIU1_LATJO|nr:vezatin [Lates japonicus]
MTEEFDEDVVFENSPLFQYLHDLGHTDFEACPTASQEEEYGGQEGDLPSPDEDLQKTSEVHSDQDVLLQEDELIELLDPSLLTPSPPRLWLTPGRGNTLPRPSLTLILLMGHAAPDSVHNSKTLTGLSRKAPAACRDRGAGLAWELESYLGDEQAQGRTTGLPASQDAVPAVVGKALIASADRPFYCPHAE